jgi:hypothetical protein
MRTLNRPMFNWGGPVKQGIMHGIREPHQLGQIAGRALPWASKVFGRVKGLFGKTVPTQAPFSKVTPRTTMVGEDIYKTKFAPGGAGPTKNIFQTTEFQPTKFGKYMAGTPEWAAAKGIYGGKGIITKPIKYGLKSPLLMGTLIWQGGKWLRSDGTEANTDEIEANVAKHGPFDHTDKKKIKKAQAAFAEAQRDTRVKKYLDMMGYDRSKKTAVADALIDASKIVSDRGTLEKKNITRDLINPIIQATSKRFDKPEQIREAVGLMSVKAAITKDLEDPQVKKLRALQIEKGELDLERGFETDMRNLLLSRKDKVNKKTLEQFARLTADKYGEPFTQVTEDTDLTTLDNGIYMSEDKIIRVTDGVPKRIV